MARIALRYQTAQDLFAACASAAEDITAVPTRQSSVDFCRMLLAGPVPEEAISFCAYLLPDRTAIWWGHECLDQLAQLLDGYDLELLALVRQRLGEPARLAPHVFTSWRLARQRSPAGWVALAAGLEEGRGGDLELNPQVMPVGRAVQTGILAGLARVAAADRPEVLSAFAQMGLQLAETSYGGMAF